ncbi:MAG: AsmA family protein, partial [Methylotenera sp.]
VPDITSLLASTKVLAIHIKQLQLQKSALDLASALSNQKAAENQQVSPVHVRQISIDTLQLDWPGMKLPTLTLALNLDVNHAMESAQIETQDGKVRLDVSPEGKSHRIALRADQFTLPVGLPLLVDKANVDMLLKGQVLDIGNIDVSMYQGKINGSMRVMWDRNWRMQGQLKVAQLSLQKPSRIISPKVYLSGALQSQGNFSAAAKDASKLADNLRADFKF